MQKLYVRLARLITEAKYKQEAITADWKARHPGSNISNAELCTMMLPHPVEHWSIILGYEGEQRWEAVRRVREDVKSRISELSKMLSDLEVATENQSLTVSLPPNFRDAIMAGHKLVDLWKRLDHDFASSFDQPLAASTVSENSVSSLAVRPPRQRRNIASEESDNAATTTTPSDTTTDDEGEDRRRTWASSKRQRIEHDEARSFPSTTTDTDEEEGHASGEDELPTQRRRKRRRRTTAAQAPSRRREE